MSENKIVVGVDESEGSQRALEWALEEAALRRANVELVHVVAPVHSYYPYYYPYWFEALELTESREETAEASVREMLASALAKAGGEPPGIVVELAPRIGIAPNILLEESQNAALLVVGSRGRGGFTGLLLGSVSQQVVQHARCPVVVIPPERRPQGP